MSADMSDSDDTTIFQVSRGVLLPIFIIQAIVGIVQTADGIWRLRVNKEPQKFLHKYFRWPALGVMITRVLVQLDEFAKLGVHSNESVSIIRAQFWVCLTACMFIFLYAILNSLDNVRLENDIPLGCSPKIYCLVSGSVIAISFEIYFFLFAFWRPYNFIFGLVSLNIVALIVLFEIRYISGHWELQKNVSAAVRRASSNTRIALRQVLLSWNILFWTAKVVESVIVVFYIVYAVNQFRTPYEEGHYFEEVDARAWVFNLANFIINCLLIKVTWERLPWFQSVLVTRNHPSSSRV
eukprot:774595_1